MHLVGANGNSSQFENGLIVAAMCSNETTLNGCQDNMTDTFNNVTTNMHNPYTQAWYIQAIYGCLFFPMILVATGGNLIVIWIVLAHKRMRGVTNFFLVNLAIADALMSVFNTFFSFIYMMTAHWFFGEIYCKFFWFIAPCTISASVFTFNAIAVDRYMAIIHPLKPRMRAVNVLLVIGLIWTASFLIAFPNLLYAITDTNMNGRTVCYLEWPDGSNTSTSDFVYNIFLMLINYFVPVTLLGLTYTRVGITLWSSQAIGERTPRQEETIKSKRKVVKMMVVVVVIFAVCWLPQHMYFLIVNQHDYLGYAPATPHVYMVIFWFAMSNSMYNPIIYCWMNARFRQGFKKAFRWLPCIDWRPLTAMGYGTHTFVRISVSEATRSEGNGTTVHTVADGASLDESVCGPALAMLPHKSGARDKK